MTKHSSMLQPSPFDLGVQAYDDGKTLIDANPYDQYQSPDEWDEFIDGWATARLNLLEPWRQKVIQLLGHSPRYAVDLGECFDDGMTPEQAADLNTRRWIEQQKAE